MFIGRSPDGATWCCDGIVKTRIDNPGTVKMLQSIKVPDVGNQSSDYWNEFPTYEKQYEQINGKLNDLLNK